MHHSKGIRRIPYALENMRSTPSFGMEIAPKFVPRNAQPTRCKSLAFALQAKRANTPRTSAVGMNEALASRLPRSAVFPSCDVRKAANEALAFADETLQLVSCLQNSATVPGP